MLSGCSLHQSAHFSLLGLDCQNCSASSVKAFLSASPPSFATFPVRTSSISTFKCFHVPAEVSRRKSTNLHNCRSVKCYQGVACCEYPGRARSHRETSRHRPNIRVVHLQLNQLREVHGKDCAHSPPEQAPHNVSWQRIIDFAGAWFIVLHTS